MGALADSVAQSVTEGLLPRGATVLVACSGGADSVSLAASVAQHGGVTVAIGHVDHGLRTESRKEAEQVRALAARLAVPFYLERLENLDIRGLGLEAAARVARYAALIRLAREAGAGVVATAHTRRDQAETLLLRLVRGAGPGGLASVRRQRPLAPGIALVRPLLDVSREETEAFCREQALPFTLDPHNSDPARTRARLRRLWPSLLELNPRLEEALAKAAESLAEEDELLSAMLPATLEVGTLRTLHPALLRRALLKGAVEAGVHPERGHLDALRQLLSRGRGMLDLPGGRAEIRDGALHFRKPVAPEATSPAPEVAIPGPGDYAWRSRTLTVVSGPGEGIAVDHARAPYPWTLRGHRAGDRFRPAGGRSRKVSDLWIDADVPRTLRPDLALLADARGRLFFVEGLRPGDPARGPLSATATFRIRPEMKGLDEPLTSRRRAESSSATMDPRPVKEPR